MLSENRMISLLPITAAIAVVFLAAGTANALPEVSDAALLAALDKLATETDLDALASRLQSTNGNVARRLPQIGQRVSTPLEECEAQLVRAKTGLARFKVVRRKPVVSDDYLAALIECYAIATGELVGDPSPTPSGS